MKRVFYVIGFLVAMTAFSGLPSDAGTQGADKTVAIVNGEKISSKEVEEKLQRYKNLDPNLYTAIRKDILDEVIEHTIITQFLKKEGINVSQQEVDKTVDNIRERMKANPKTANIPFEELLEASGSSLEELKEEIKTNLGLKTYFERTANDKTLHNYFAANKAMYGGEMVRASHILVDTRLMESQEELNKAKQKIEDIKKELDKGADFAELARKYSDCPSRERGGDLSYFPRKGVMVESFAEAAFQLKPGQVSDPVKTQFGYHLIKVTDRKEPTKDVKYEDVKELVKENYVEEEVGKLTQRLRQEAKVEIKE